MYFFPNESYCKGGVLATRGEAVKQFQERIEEAAQRAETSAQTKFMHKAALKIFQDSDDASAIQFVDAALALARIEGDARALYYGTILAALFRGTTANKYAALQQSIRLARRQLKEEPGDLIALVNSLFPETGDSE